MNGIREINNDHFEDRTRKIQNYKHKKHYRCIFL